MENQKYLVLGLMADHPQKTILRESLSTVVIEGEVQSDKVQLINVKSLIQ